MQWIRAASLLLSLLILYWLVNAYNLELRDKLAAALWTPIAAAGLLLLINLFIAFLRYGVLCRAVGVHVGRPVLLSSFFMGQVGTLVPLGVVGQAAGRSAILARAGQAASSVAMLSLIEKAIALLSLVVLVVPAIWL